MRTLWRLAAASSNCSYTALQPLNGLVGGGWMWMAAVTLRSWSRSRAGRLLSSLTAAVPRRSEQRQARVVAQLVAQDQQRERLFRSEVCRRQQTGAGNPVALPFVVEGQRQAR